MFCDDGLGTKNRSRRYNDNRENRRERRSRGGRSDRRGGRGRRGGYDDFGEKSLSVFLGNLSYDTSWQDIKDHCRRNRIKDVERADIFKKSNNKSKGCG